MDRTGLAGEYSALDVTSNEIPGIMDMLRSGKLDGVNVTIPHKQAVMPHLDELQPDAAAIGAVNCIISRSGQLTGANTDWRGFSHLLSEAGVSPMGRTFILLGAGGAARAVLFALLQEGAASVYIINRNRERAQKLVSDFVCLQGCTVLRAADWFDIEQYLSEPTVVLNTTPVGLPGSEPALPMPPEFMADRNTYVDLIYHPCPTPFLKAAADTGAQTVGGMDMFIYQGLASLEFWTGKKVSAAIDLDELRDFLIRILDGNYHVI